MTRLSAIPMAAVMAAVCWGTLVIVWPVLAVLVTSALAHGLAGWLAMAVAR